MLQQLRDWFTGPIIILSARDQEPQKVKALDHGADDYMTKPFGTGELLARIRTALRHSRRTEREETLIHIADVAIDLAARVVTKRGEQVHLTPLEYKLFVTMVKHAGKVLTHRFLLREVWGPLDAHENHYLRVFVAGLRRKLEDDSTRPRMILPSRGSATGWPPSRPDRRRFRRRRNSTGTRLASPVAFTAQAGGHRDADSCG